MALLQLLWRAEKAALIGVIICATVVAALAFLTGLTLGSIDLGVAFAWAGFAYASIIGGILALVIGAPVYSLMTHRGATTVPRLLVIAAVPGLAIALFDSTLGVCVSVGGVVVALITHAFVVRRRNEA
jgi:hypothetical protein